MDNLSQIFIEAAGLLLVGMGFVFAFLGVLIYAIKLLAYVASLFPESVPVTRTSSVSSADGTKVSPQVVAAITAAIAQYRKPNK
ncbi:OadG family transporter subunit [Thalassotalea ponticola]|uniref:OadG family protein n=1 Tax=Thalassotalea ponticola TaxID=1523392 RepID=UPI0025B4330F|nr:OadG family transporter subunit [Thalassotalea ponticola]MDN3652150.1 OadG family transporter subunit [Thalassotalea ponticola]